MAEPFLGEIRLMSIGYAPRDWAQCNGQFLPINQNQGLFSLLGTTFGGNGQTTFALPDLRGKVPIHVGSGFTLGQAGGQQAHTLTINELPTHIHRENASSSNADTPLLPNNLLARCTQANVYRTPSTNLVALNPGTVTATGGSQAHENMQPYLTLTFMIALIGIFPSPN